MGRGDKRSFKGKVFRGSFGNTRRRTEDKARGTPVQQKEQKKKG
jgi:ribosomal small subunit protein bTHX